MMRGTTPTPRRIYVAMTRPVLDGLFSSRITTMPPARRTETTSVAAKDITFARKLTQSKRHQRNPGHSRSFRIAIENVHCERDNGSIEDDLGNAHFGVAVQHFGSEIVSLEVMENPELGNPGGS
jgi:hypothetical protein